MENIELKAFIDIEKNDVQDRQKRKHVMEQKNQAIHWALACCVRCTESHRCGWAQSHT
jgi:hypothetical protein